jgi:hypothetical protein
MAKSNGSNTARTKSTADQQGNGQTPPPLTSENVFDNLEQARYKGTPSGPVGKKVLTFIPVKKPEPHWFIRVHPTLREELLIYEDRDERETYYVANYLEDELERFGRPALLALGITTQATLFVWPLYLLGKFSGGNSLSRQWTDSARKAAAIAERQWISVRSNRQAGGCEPLVAEKAHPEPEWPDIDKTQMLKLAFGDRCILEADHPVLRKLREG